MVVRSDAVDSQRDAGKEIKIRKINGEWLTFCPTFSTDGEKPSLILCMLQLPFSTT